MYIPSIIIILYLLAIAAVKKQVTVPPRNALNTFLVIDDRCVGHKVVNVAIIDPIDPGLAKLHKAKVATISDLRWKSITCENKSINAMTAIFELHGTSYKSSLSEFHASSYKGLWELYAMYNFTYHALMCTNSGTINKLIHFMFWINKNIYW